MPDNRMAYIGCADNMRKSNELHLDQRGQWIANIGKDMWTGMTSRGPLDMTLNEWKEMHVDSLLTELSK